MAELEPIAIEDLNQVADIDLGDESYVPDEFDLRIAEFFKEQEASEAKAITEYSEEVRKVLVFHSPVR